MAVSTDLLTWQELPIEMGGEIYAAISGTIASWQNATVDLGSVDGKSNVYARFGFNSNEILTFDGWYIDDVSLTASSSLYDDTAYQYRQGTSMAAAHVSGLAALIKSQSPSLDALEIKAAIENSVDYKPALDGKLLTAGRVNALHALIPPAPADLSAEVFMESGQPNGTPGNRIELSWTDNSPNELGFVIERKKKNEEAYSRISVADAGSTAYSDSVIDESETCYYRIYAVGLAGNSDYSNIALATLYPAAPGGLTAVALSADRIQLTWQDNSAGETAFVIERKTGSEQYFAQIAAVDAGITGYSDSGLQESTLYLYRVYAVGLAGNSVYGTAQAETAQRAEDGGSGGETDIDDASGSSGAGGGKGGGDGGCFISVAACR